MSYFKSTPLPPSGVHSQWAGQQAAGRPGTGQTRPGRPRPSQPNVQSRPVQPMPVQAKQVQPRPIQTTAQPRTAPTTTEAAEEYDKFDEVSVEDDDDATFHSGGVALASTSSTTIASESALTNSRHTSTYDPQGYHLESIRPRLTNASHRLSNRFSQYSNRRYSQHSNRLSLRHSRRLSDRFSELISPIGPETELTDINSEKDLEKRLPISPEQEDVDPNLIEWNGPDDPENPQNFPRWKKWLFTCIMGSVTLCITFASSVFSTATLITAEKFDVSPEVMILGTSLFVLGFAVGPPIFGPLSELYGRKLPMFIPFFIFAIFQIPVAVAQNLHTIMLCRFFGGMFGCAPLAIMGGALTDFWGPLDRGVAMTIFAGATFIGPVAGPIVGGFIVQSHLGWRWTEYITAIMSFFFGTVGFLIIPETYGPVLLSRRAKRIRFETRNWAIHAKHDEQIITLHSVMQRYVLRPFIMLIEEPILSLMTLYMALIYGIMYLFFEAYPIAFQEQRGWNSGVGSLPFLAITLGVVAGCLLIVWSTKTRFARKLKQHGRVKPEERLIPMMIGGAIFPVGMLWFAWTSDPDITWVPQVLSGIAIGAGILLIFLQGLNYIIDCYLMFANSALAANTFVRSLFGAGFPLFANQMYHKLGVDWASTLLGCLCAALFPVPILFYFYGEKIRKMSKFSPY